MARRPVPNMSQANLSTSGRNFSGGPVDIQNSEKTLLQKLAGFGGLKTTIDNAQLIANSPGFMSFLTGSNKNIDDSLARSKQLTSQAMAETDPIKKKALLDEARAVGQGLDTLSGELGAKTRTYRAQGGITDKEIARHKNGKFDLEFGGRRGIGQSAELASYVLPTKLIPGGATAIGRIGSSALRGGLGAGLQGTAEAARTADSLGEAAIEVGSDATMGALLGGALQAGAEGAKGVIKLGKAGKKFLKDQYKADLEASLKPNESYRRMARERNIDVAEEYLKKDHKGNPIFKFTGDRKEDLLAAKRTVKESAVKMRRLLKDNQKIHNVDKIIKETYDDLYKKAGSQAQKTELKAWANDKLKGVLEKYGSPKINSTALLNQKQLAAQSSYRGLTNNVVEGTRGQADALFEQKIKQALLDSAGNRKRQIADLLRTQEVGIHFENLIAKAIDKSPRSSTSDALRKSIYQLSLIGKGVGWAGEKAVAASQKPLPQNTAVNLLRVIGNGGKNLYNVTGKPATKVYEAAAKNPQYVINPLISQD